MGIFRLSWMVWTSWPGPWLKAELILADPPVPATGTYRSRGIDSTAAWRGGGARGGRMVQSLALPAPPPTGAHDQPEPQRGGRGGGDPAAAVHAGRDLPGHATSAFGHRRRFLPKP